MNKQLALAIQLNDEATLSDFFWGDNILLKQHINQILCGSDERLLLVWGTKGSGKSHLLQGCCQAADSSKPAVYLPLDLLRGWGPEVLDGIEEQALICVDNIDAIAGLSAWEEAFFHFYNRIRDQGESSLIISSSTPLANLPIQLADLKSRLSWGLVFQLHELSEQDKIKVLQQLAQKRGFHLPESVVQFLLNRCARNMHDLQALLNKLDEASLVAQRKITIPFVKETLSI